MNDQPVNAVVESAVTEEPTIEVVETAPVVTAPATDAPAFDAETLDATQNLIIRLTQQLEELEKNQKDQRDMLKGIFENDEKLQEAEMAAKEQTRNAKSRKSELGQSQQAVDLKLKIADLSEDIKMVQESLNTHLLNYYQLTGSKAVDFPGGEEREMVIKAKLKKGGPKQE